MMKIDRSNYEIVIIDWLDGNLNDTEAAELFRFLGENPDLNEEFSELELVRLTPPKSQNTDKSKLRKSIDDLSASQFEYLCAAYIENDLSAEQQSELLQMTANDPARKRTLEEISRTKLSPVDIVYPDKKLLLKRTAYQSAFRLSIMTLSAAAVIVLAFILYYTRSRELPVRIESTAQATVSDSSHNRNSDQNIPEKEPVIATQKSNLNNKNVASIQRSSKTLVPSAGTQTQIPEPEDLRTAVVIEKIDVHHDISFKSEVPENLIALSYHPAASQPADDGRSKFGKLIARTFREKFLKDRTPADSPLKGYEIAKAGVSGLNKLLGWEMALSERKDVEGNLRSVYFSSKILKFNAPVKKTETPR